MGKEIRKNEQYSQNNRHDAIGNLDSSTSIHCYSSTYSTAATVVKAVAAAVVVGIAVLVVVGIVVLAAVGTAVGLGVDCIVVAPFVEAQNRK